MLLDIKKREIGIKHSININFDYKLKNKLFDDDSDREYETSEEEENIYTIIMFYTIGEYIICLFSNYMVYIINEKTVEILYCINELNRFEYITSLFLNEHLNDIIFISKFDENDYLSVYKISNQNLKFNENKLTKVWDSYYIKEPENTKDYIFDNCKIKNSGYIEFDNYCKISIINTELFYFQIWSLENYQQLYNISSYNRIYEIKVNYTHFILLNNKDVGGNIINFWNIPSSRYFYKLELVDKSNLEKVDSILLPGSDNLSDTFTNDFNFIECLEYLIYIKYTNKNLLIYNLYDKKILEIENTSYLTKSDFIILPRNNRILTFDNDNDLIIYNLFGIKLYKLELIVNKNLISFKCDYISFVELNENFIYILNLKTFSLKKINIDENIINKITFISFELSELYIVTKYGNIYKFSLN